jgi:hypothetical protein
LLIASLTVSAFAQKHQRPKESKGSGRTTKAPAPGRDPASQELRKVEQSSAKAAGSRHSETGRAPRQAAVLRADKQERNPQINAKGSAGHSRGKGSKTADSTKGRLRHKGSHR